MPQTRKTRSKATRKRSTRSGLTKVAKKQTKVIVENAIKKDNVLKYFDSNQVTVAVAPAPTIVGNIKEVSAIAFSSTTEFDAEGDAVKYADQEYVPLYLSRPFKKDDANDDMRTLALNSQYALPKMARASFSIERVAYEVGFAQGGTPSPTPNMARSLPIYYRIIKVGFKASNGTQEVLNPNLDLMTDVNGQPTGIDQQNFDRLDMRHAPINTKKYTKLLDLTGTISQNNIITPSDFAGQLTDIVTQKNGKSAVHMTIPFKLSQRKNGKLFYEDPQGPGTQVPKAPSSGGQRELLIMMFTYMNGHTLLGGPSQPQCPTSADIQIKVRSTSAFVDAQ